jgi:Family of unknown function (DUF6174)
MKIILKSGIWALLVLMLFQCSSNPTSPSKDILTARQKWNNQGLESYTFNYNNSCFCLWASVTFKIAVFENKIVNVSDTAGKEAVDSTEYQYFYTIDQLFDLLEEADKQNAAQLDYSFNKDFGYPEHIYVNYSEQIADDESSYTIDSLRALN